jgi:RNA polymerase-binding transcription factor DksA
MTQTELESLGLRLQARLQAMEMCPAQVRLMRAALDRIAAGTYGNCLTCRGAIGVVRLTALPHAGFCIPCQEDTFYQRDSGNVSGGRFLEEGGNNT